MSDPPGRELRIPEVDQTVPPRPEEEVADAGIDSAVTDADPAGGRTAPGGSLKGGGPAPG
jgi:hypothetical protein